ncbi:MAG: alpha-ketoglutarate-dependent dioxygenase AlkB [Parvibaculum sp.]|uniref:alpha-ketoglutarate-dependent dioxygenase AlkB n=1 Tax=Parvibaculum sp. TaxID=2024848 RepID=UPI0027268D7F|nr:alpha-ketoglutarate-dependent dioxygenase AlkB [Parvibaculum sp.]MDO8837793.1 alpha-ketoglutarate-dependent dioxygenase AlkB [Parvibaculum sp.]
MNAIQLPQGAIYLPDFVTAAEERELVGTLDTGEWNTEMKRRVQHFGWRYDYRARAVTADAFLGTLPDWLSPVCARLKTGTAFGRHPDQMIANEYLPGQGISAHVDCVPCFADRIASLSLLSACEMRFRHRENGEKHALILEPRALLILTGAARYDWTHEIPARATDIVDSKRLPRGRRVSMTFRNVRRGG